MIPMGLVASTTAVIIALWPILALQYASEGFGMFATPVAKTQATIAVEVQVAEQLARSANATQRGKAVAYQLEVPEGLIKKTSNNPMIELEREASDGRFQLQVIAHDEKEDLSTMAKTRLAANSGKGVQEAKLEAVRNVNSAGVDRVESRIMVTIDDGTIVRENLMATSNRAGIVMIAIHIIDSLGTNDIYQKIVDQILQSFRLMGPTVPSVKPRGSGASKRETFRSDDTALAKSDPGPAVIQGSDHKGPAWNAEFPHGEYLLGEEKIRLI